MQVNIQPSNPFSRLPKVSSTFAGVILASVASAALTSLIFLSAYSPQSSTLTTQGRVASTSQEAAVEAVVEKAIPSVVSIVATKDLPVFEQQFSNPFGNDNFFNQFFGPQFRVPQYQQKGTEKKEVAGGTGFIVSSDGTILTNKHVVDIEGADFTVIMPDGKRVPAEVKAKDPVQDIAVLHINLRDLPALSLGDSDSVKLGQSVIAIGNTLGQFQNTVSSGIVSGLARKLTAGNQSGGGSEVIEGAIQTDAAINPGNSGGPLLNLSGEVIGINTAIVVGSQNVGFAVPINKAKKGLEDVQASGKISYAYLGARYISVDADIQKARGLSVSSGALILGSADGKEPGVVPDSPAAKAGLREGDVIERVNGQAVDDQHSLASLIQQYKVGETVTLHVLSGKDEKDVRVTLEERPQ